jgi:hypothetical protein
MRFAASEPATNKALQEVRVLGGFGLFGDFFYDSGVVSLPGVQGKHFFWYQGKLDEPLPRPRNVHEVCCE